MNATERDPDGVRRRLRGSSLDITAHELTHAVTEMTAGLEYQCQSGALNESMSDIFASNVDDDDWVIGEDLPGGALRDMEHPENGDPPQPAHVDDFNEMPNDGNPFNDHGGVHYNSGIPNHAYYLMVKAIGRDAAEAIVYRALTEELGPDSGFEDFRTASLAVAAAVGRGQPGARGTNDSAAVLDGTVGSSGGGGMLMRTLLLRRGSRSCCSPAAATTAAPGASGTPTRGPVTYERGGGIAGRRDRLVVQPDGNAKLTRSRRRRSRSGSSRRGARRRSAASSTRRTSPRCPRTPPARRRCPTPSATA